MDLATVQDKVLHVVNLTLKDLKEDLTLSSKRSECDVWDSLTNLSVLLNISDELNCDLSSTMKFDTVDELAYLVWKLLN